MIKVKSLSDVDILNFFVKMFFNLNRLYNSAQVVEAVHLPPRQHTGSGGKFQTAQRQSREHVGV